MEPSKLSALLLCLSIVVTILSAGTASVSSPFPSDMLWGASTAAYQIEGSWNVSKQPSIWDVRTHSCGGCIRGNQTGDTADDSYVRYREDTELLANLSLNAYRFSISWPRIITVEGEVNPTAVRHYDDLINGLLAAGITPLVTLFHQDLPYAYSIDPHGNETRGWNNATYLVPLFVRYASVCFAAFGDRVKHWITINEPRYLGDPYLAGHTAILAHVHTVQTYRKFKQGGVIGMVIDGAFSMPSTRSAADVEAAERAMVFAVGLFADPIFFGDYPQIIKQRLAGRLPEFTAAEKKLLKDNVPDVFYLNHYTSNVAQNDTTGECGETGVCTGSTYANGTQIGPRGESPWLYVYPAGIRGLLNWVYQRYHHPTYITENGVDVPNESALTIAQALEDQFRVDYLSGYLAHLQLAVEDGVDVRGYFVWSLLDNFEWNDGYWMRFGIHYVDYHSDVLARYPKRSAQFYSDFVTWHRQRAVRRSTEPLEEQPVKAQ